jgi:hypothetical protein
VRCLHAAFENWLRDEAAVSFDEFAADPTSDPVAGELSFARPRRPRGMIADKTGEARAERFVGGIVADCLSLSTFPERGTRNEARRYSTGHACEGFQATRLDQLFGRL